MHVPAQTTPGAPAVSLEQMLAAKEQRAAPQAAALARFDRPLVSVTVVMPGPVKDGWLPRRVLAEALQQLEAVSNADRAWVTASDEGVKMVLIAASCSACRAALPVMPGLRLAVAPRSRPAASALK
jgi:phosphoribosyl-dephospho-CoA transferase